MEYCPCITLKEFLSTDPPWIYRWGLARQISDTVKSIYERGIFHGDLHDKNIIINLDNHENWLKILDLGTSIFSGKQYSQNRDAHLLYRLSFELLPCVKDLAFYNDRSISVLPAPLLNKAFRAIVNISNPKMVKTDNTTIEISVQKHPFWCGYPSLARPPDGYLSPDYHQLYVWELVSLVERTPLFSLKLVEQFLLDFGFGKKSKSEFYNKLYSRIVAMESFPVN